MVQKIKTHELERVSREQGRRDETIADLPAPRNKHGPQLKGPPRSNLLNLNIQIQGY